MNYEKKYKEAQKWIESIYSELSHEQQMEAEAFFPELKESEDVDKKIREEIIATIYLYYGKPLEDEAKEMIAWLEKQEGCEYIKKDWLEHIKQSWYKEGFIDGKYSDGTSKEWTKNDAATLKELIDFLENGTAKLQHDLTRYANWLKIQLTPIKKQGEPTDINPSEFDLRLNKLLKQFETLPKEELVNSLSFYLNVVQNDGTYKPDEEQGEQKPADKVEPWFKVGDWVVTSYGKVNQVITVDEDCDGFTLDDDTYFSGSWKDGYHLWTIQDAKNGDVLYSLDSNRPFIYKERNVYEQAVAYCGLNVYGKFFVWDTKDCVITLNNYVPATKEQRDTLFAKMKETGYEWSDKDRKLIKVVK